MRKYGTILVAILVISAMLQIALATAPKDFWLTKANMPSEREGLTVTPVNGTIYAIDGYGIVGGVFVAETNVNEAYDPATDTWTTKASAPTNRTELTAAAQGGNIYVFGGRNNLSLVVDTNEIYNTTTDSWSPGTSMPTARAGLASAAPNDTVYAIGGRTGSTPRSGSVLSTVEAYNVTTDTWTTVTSLNEARSDLAAVDQGGKIYAIGGWNGTSVVGTLEVYDPTTNTWTTLASMPTPRSNIVADVKGNVIYVIGGLNQSGLVPSGLLNTTEAFDISTGTWSTKASMPTARAEMDSARVEDKIYVIGGGIFGALVGGNATEAYVAG